MASRKDQKGRVLKNGESQRKDGRYQFSYYTVSGKRCYIYATSLEELRKKERDYHLATFSGANHYDSNVTINYLYDRAMKLKVGIKDSTYASYLQYYNNHVRDEFGKLKIAKVGHSDVLAFYNYLLRKKKLSVKTISGVHVQLLAAFELALQDGVIAKSPLDGALRNFKKVASKEDKKVHALTFEEQKAFLGYICGHPIWGRYHSIFQIMLGTGLRVGELCGLRWQDVDLEERIIDINHGLSKVKAIKGESKERLVISLPKTKAGIRRIPIMKPVVDAFIEEYRIAEIKDFKSVVIDGYTDFIFTKENGNVYDSTRLDLALRQIVKSYNKQEKLLAKTEGRNPLFLPHISNHMLRHTFCTRLCERDVNIKVIQTLMGHANINVTMNIYAEVSEKKQFEEIDKLADELTVF